MNNTALNHMAGQQVLIVHTPNRVKEKIAPGFDGDISLSEETLIMAEQLVSDYAKVSEQEIFTLIKEARDLLSSGMMALSTPKNEQKFKTLINRILDLSALHQKQATEEFAKSFLRFLERVNMHKLSHHVILKAYLDVIYLCCRQKIHDFHTGKAIKLRQQIDRAIEQNI